MRHSVLRDAADTVTSPRAHLLLIAAVYLLLTLPLLSKPLYHDELYNTLSYLRAAPELAPGESAGGHPHLPGAHRTWGNEFGFQLTIHPPLVSAFYLLWVRLAGDSEWALHVPAWIFGLGSLVLLYQLGALLFSRYVALGSALALACSLSFVEYSTQAVHAGFELGVYLLSLWLLARVMLHRDRVAWRWLCGANILGVLTFHHYLAYLVVQLVVLWLLRKRLRLGRKYFAAAGALLATVAGLLWLGHVGTAQRHPDWMQSNPSALLTVVQRLPFEVTF